MRLLTPLTAGLRSRGSAVVMMLILAGCATSPQQSTIRFATFNAAMGLAEQGALAERLIAGDDPALHALAEIVQTVRPDVLLLNEFDYLPGVASARLLHEHYLSRPHGDSLPIDFPWSHAGPVNTGVASGLDLDADGKTDGPADAWGFGFFPGQYGMLILSRLPLDADAVRSFQLFAWNDMPNALQPQTPSGEAYYPPNTWSQLRLSSKSHWDVPVNVGGTRVHFLVSHPTPPVFDGLEDRNGRRNHDEIRFWADYVSGADYIQDDGGGAGGLGPDAHFVIAGDQNSDPSDGDSRNRAISQLLKHHAVDNSCEPTSEGAAEASRLQGGANLAHLGNPAADTSDFSDRVTGNLRLDYVLPSISLQTRTCGVFWPRTDEPAHGLLGHSDHRMVWVDVVTPERR